MRKLSSLILLTLSLILVPSLSGASGTVVSTQTPTVADGHQKLGNIQVVVNAGSLKSGDTMIVHLPQNSSFGSSFRLDIQQYFGALENRLVIPVTFQGNSNWDGEQPIFEVSQLDGRRLSIQSLINQDIENDLVFYLQLEDIQIDKGSFGPINITLENSPGSGFPNGEVTIGKVYGEETTFELNTTEFEQQKDQMKFKFHLKEDQANAFKENKKLKVHLPDGLIWDHEKKATFLKHSSGDLRIESNGKRELSIQRMNVKEKKASEWFIPLKVVAEDTAKSGKVILKAEWNEAENITIGSYEKPSIKKEHITFKIGSQHYIDNGKGQTMDVAPYLKNGRAFLPVRYVAEAIGVSEDQILWDTHTKIVTITAPKVMQVKVGSNIMVIDGNEITMNAPVAINKDRVMLPFRSISEAFGKAVEWDESTKSITIEK